MRAVCTSQDSPAVHEGVVVSVGERQLVEDLVLAADSVGLLGAAGAVVPGEGDRGPAVVVIHREDEPVLHDVTDHGSHLGLPDLPLLQPQLLPQLGPVGETSVEVLGQ